MTKEEIKNKIAISKGYPSWKEMYDFVARENSLPCVVAQLIESAMDEYAEQLAKERAEYWEKRCLAAEDNIQTFSKWQSNKYEATRSEDEEFKKAFEQANKKWLQIKSNNPHPFI